MLEVENLSLQAGDFRVRGICLGVGTGETFVLMGPTGSGKSLLARCICGLVRAEAGYIRIGGRDVTALEPRRRRVGYVPQDGALFPHMSVARNLTFAPRVGGTRHAAALREMRPLVGLLGLDPLLDRHPDTLSGGERQKVALARALATQPDLLVLDEPLSALDEPSRREVSTLLRRVQREVRVATIHICHNTEEAESLADRVGIMHAGELVQTGTIDALRRAPAGPAVARLLGGP